MISKEKIAELRKQSKPRKINIKKIWESTVTGQGGPRWGK